MVDDVEVHELCEVYQEMALEGQKKNGLDGSTTITGSVGRKTGKSSIILFP